MEQMLQEHREGRPAVPQLPEHDAGPAERPADQPVPRRSAEAADSPTTRRRRRQEARGGARWRSLKAVAGLQLQSIMYSGTRKACMINNTLYTRGPDRSTAFTIEKINPASVVVKQRRVPVRAEDAEVTTRTARDRCSGQRDARTATQDRRRRTTTTCSARRRQPRKPPATPRRSTDAATSSSSSGQPGAGRARARASSSSCSSAGRSPRSSSPRPSNVQAQTPGKSIAQILLTMNAASEAQILSALAETLGLAFEQPDKAQVDAAGVRAAAAGLHPQAARPPAAVRRTRRSSSA